MSRQSTAPLFSAWGRSGAGTHRRDPGGQWSDGPVGGALSGRRVWENGVSMCGDDSNERECRGTTGWAKGSPEAGWRVPAFSREGCFLFRPFDASGFCSDDPSCQNASTVTRSPDVTHNLVSHGPGTARLTVSADGAATKPEYVSFAPKAFIVTVIHCDHDTARWSFSQVAVPSPRRIRTPFPPMGPSQRRAGVRPASSVSPRTASIPLGGREEGGSLMKCGCNRFRVLNIGRLSC